MKKKREYFKVKARALGLRKEIRPGDLNNLADELEVEEYLKKKRQLYRQIAHNRL